MTILKSAVVAALAALWLLAVAAPASAQQTTHGCACIHNTTKVDADYRYRWGDGPWRDVRLQPGYRNWICWAYETEQKRSPTLTFLIDVDPTPAQAWTAQVLERVQTTGAHCDKVGRGGHYDIVYRPDSNESFLQVTKRTAAAAAPGPGSPPARPPAPSPAPPGQQPFEGDRSGKTNAIRLALSDGGELKPRAVFERVSPAVYVVRVPGAQGSAVAVSERELLTNCHVLGARTEATLEHEGRKTRARLVSANARADRCILQSDAPLARWVRVRPFADVKVGEPAYTIGAPKGLELTIAEGIVSSKRTADGDRIVQTSAPISSGSSGGGLFDAQGHLIGITTWMRRDAQNLNFAIAAEEYAK